MSISFWNNRYQTAEYVYGTKPNAYFKKFIDAIACGKLLLPGEGEGRNAVYAAMKGWHVDACDFAANGREKALILAAQHQVEINYDMVNIISEHFPYKTDNYDAAFLGYTHVPQKDQLTLLLHVTKALKLGGYLGMEVFHRQQLAYASGGPKDSDMLFTLGGLEAFLMHQFNVHALGLHIIYLNESVGHNGKAAVIRLFAQKV